MIITNIWKNRECSKPPTSLVYKPQLGSEFDISPIKNPRKKIIVARNVVSVASSLNGGSLYLCLDQLQYTTLEDDQIFESSVPEETITMSPPMTGFVSSKHQPKWYWEMLQKAHITIVSKRLCVKSRYIHCLIP